MLPALKGSKASPRSGNPTSVVASSPGGIPASARAQQTRSTLSPRERTQSHRSTHQSGGTLIPTAPVQNPRSARGTMQRAAPSNQTQTQSARALVNLNVVSSTAVTASVDQPRGSHEPNLMGRPPLPQLQSSSIPTSAGTSSLRASHVASSECSIGDSNHTKPSTPSPFLGSGAGPAPQAFRQASIPTVVSQMNVSNGATSPPRVDMVTSTDGESAFPPSHAHAVPEEVQILALPRWVELPREELTPMPASTLTQLVEGLPRESRVFMERFAEISKEEGATVFGTLSKLVPGAIEFFRESTDRMNRSEKGMHSSEDGETASNEFLNSKRNSLWYAMVSNLTCRTVRYNDNGDFVEFDAWRGACAVLFIDLSGYSKVTSLIGATQGAQGISDIVNEYLMRILKIAVGTFDGDVVTFAGDAIVVVWNCPTAEQSCLVAATCAAEVQLLCGEHPVEGTDLSFRLHMGISYGEIESEVFVPKQALTMQRAFPFVTGPAVVEAARIVNVAAPREVCVSTRVVTLIGHQLEFQATTVAGAHTLIGVPGMESINMKPTPYTQRRQVLEQWLVHPIIIQRLQFGMKASHLAEMRHLCVLFILKKGKTRVADWFHEMQEELDLHRCPIVQIMNDDKGVHVVAAVNLFVSEDNPSMLGIACARALVTRGVECLVGIATGSTFCGIVGGSETAARWDITGEACVRACRLMQAATKLGVQVVVDKSVFEEASDVSQLQPIGSVSVKGTDQPVPVFGLADYANAASSRIVNGRDLEPAVHAEARAQLQQRLTDLLETGLYPVGIVSGSLCTGKLGVVLQASKSMNLVPVVHYSTAGSSTLALALTLGEWFIHHPNVLVKSAAQRILSALQAHQWARAMNRSLELVALSVKLGLRTALIATHAHFLDRMSLSLVKEITARSASASPVKPMDRSSLSPEAEFSLSASSIDQLPGNPGGAWCTFLTHAPLYDSMTVERLAAKVDVHLRPVDSAHLGSSQESNRQATVTSRRESFQTMVIEGPQPLETVVIVEVDVTQALEIAAAAKRVLRVPSLSPVDAMVFWELADGHLPLALISGAFMSKLYFKAREESQRTGKPMTEISIVTKEGEAGILQAGIDRLRDASWTELAPSSLNRLTVVFDVLPPRFQLLLKVVAGMTMQRQLWCPVALISKVVENLVSSRVAVTAEADVVTLTDLKILRADHRGVRFFNPALRDYVTELLTKRQRVLLNQLCAGLYASTLDGSAGGTVGQSGKSGADDPVRRLVLARFTFFGYGLTEAYYQHLKAGWKKVLKMPFGTERSRIETQYANEFRLQKVDPIEVIGVQPQRIFDRDPAKVGEKVPDLVVDVKNYTADICLGPLGGLLGLLGSLVSRRYFETTTRQALTSPAELAHISILLQGYEESIVIFEKAFLREHATDMVSQIELRAREETMKLRKMTVDYELTDEAAALANATAFFQFTSTVVKERTEKWKQVMEGYCRSFIQTLQKAFYKLDGERDDKYKLRLALLIFHANAAATQTDQSPQFSIGSLGNAATTLGDSPSALTVEARALCGFHRSLMTLATLDWQTYYSPKVGLELLRDKCLRQRAATIPDFVSFLVLSYQLSLPS